MPHDSSILADGTSSSRMDTLAAMTSVGLVKNGSNSSTEADIKNKAEKIMALPPGTRLVAVPANTKVVAKSRVRRPSIKSRSVFDGRIM